MYISCNLHGSVKVNVVQVTIFVLHPERFYYVVKRVKNKYLFKRALSKNNMDKKNK